MYRPLPLFAIILLVTSPVVHSQTPSTMDSEQKVCEVWGQIAGSARLLQEGLDVEMIGHGSGAKQKVHVLTNGNFDFRSVPAGDLRPIRRPGY